MTRRNLSNLYVIRNNTCRMLVTDKCSTQIYGLRFDQVIQSDIFQTNCLWRLCFTRNK